MNYSLKHTSIIISMLFLILISCKDTGKNTTNFEINKNNESKIMSNDNDKAFNFLPTSTTNEIVVHENYTLSYNEKYEQAEWVAYELKGNSRDRKSVV